MALQQGRQFLKAKLSKRVLLTTLLITVCLFTTLANLLLAWHTLQKIVADANAPYTSETIINENQLSGTTNWQIASGKGATTEIQAYMSATSVAPGQTLTFYVSVRRNGAPYTVQFYRLGWYGGLGGRLLGSMHGVGEAQGYYDPKNYQLVGCSTCIIDKNLKFVQANWHPSFTLKIPANWITGVYIAKFIDDVSGKQTYMPFDVLGNPHSLYVAVTADTTFAAYNQWGGFSLYRGPGDLDDSAAAAIRGYAVSLDRPAIAGGLGQGLAFELAAIRWIERNGYDVSYISSIDLDENPAQLLNHRAYLDLGHDEYWSLAMRNGVEQARDKGVGLAFLGANDGFWQIRFAPDNLGHKDRTIICYKNATLDPDNNTKNKALVTVNWRDPLLGRPENALIGIMYSSWSQGVGFPWHMGSSTDEPLFDNTDLTPNATYGCDVVGYEWDRVFDNHATPPNLHILATSRVVNFAGQADTSETTYYIASSHALVFASGSIYWDYALDATHLTGDTTSTPCPKPAPIPGMQQLMANVMAALVVPHPLDW